MNFGLPNWMVATMSYGAMRKIVQLRDAHVERYDKRKKEYVKMPMLTTSKAILTLFGAATTVYGWPYFLVKDVMELEMYARGMGGFEKPTHEIDYIYI